MTAPILREIDLPPHTGAAHAAARQRRVSIQTKSDLVLRDLDVITTFPDARVGFSINTLDEGFKDDMDAAVSIARRISAMKTPHDAGIRERSGLDYVRDDDTVKLTFDAPPVMVNYFFHEEVKKSAKKGKKNA